MGTRYIRDSPLPDTIYVTVGEQYSLVVENIYSEHTIGNILVPNLRQKAGNELTFVTIYQETSEAIVIIDAESQDAG